jgi:predicted amidohydrolase YtcJ
MGKANHWLTMVLVISVGLLPACSPQQAVTPLATVETASPGDGGTQISGLTPTVEQTAPAAPADIIFHNGNVITIEKASPLAQAVAIRGNLIQAVGAENEIMAYQGLNTTVVDLQGKTLMPGIIDNHTHYLRNGWGDDVPLEVMMNNFLRFGYTSETEMHSIDDYINAMLEAEQKGEIDLRLNVYGEYNCGFLDEDRKSIVCPSWYLDHAPILDPTRMVRIPGVKIFMDGDGTPARGCPYYSFDFSPNITEVWPGVWETCKKPHGNLYLEEAQLTSVIQDIQNRGYRAAFHAMGDASIDVILNSIETALNGESNLTYRHEILHNSALRPDQFERYKQLDILAQFGGMFNVSEADWYVDAFGEEPATWSANRYALPSLGIHVSFGNDFNGRGDIENLNPFRGLYGYVTHKEVIADGSVFDPPEWVAKHKIDVARALEIMTIEGAYAVSMEEYTGSIKPGKYADLIIISDDPLTIDPDRLIDIQVFMTMVNGMVKYCASGKEDFCPVISSAQIPPVFTPIATQSVTLPGTPTSDIVQTAQVKYDCDKKGGSPIPVDRQDFILTYLKWGAATKEQLNDYQAALQYAVWVNGEQIHSSVDYGKVEKSADGQFFILHSMFDVGVLQPGEYQIRTVLTFDKKIFDGSEYYGPGTQYSKIEGTCSVIVE